MSPLQSLQLLQLGGVHRKHKLKRHTNKLRKLEGGGLLTLTHWWNPSLMHPWPCIALHNYYGVVKGWSKVLQCITQMLYTNSLHYILCIALHDWYGAVHYSLGQYIVSFSLFIQSPYTIAVAVDQGHEDVRGMGGIRILGY